MSTEIETQSPESIPIESTHHKTSAEQRAPERASAKEGRPPQGRLRGKVWATDDLTSLQIERMFQLMQSYYENMDKEQFKKDLFEKDHVILLSDKSTGILQGFSTLLTVRLQAENKKVLGVYSGDTVLDKNYWGSAALGVTFLSYLWRLKVKNGGTPVYWFLISKGYKTYLLMANNFSTHFPRYEMATPHYFKDLMNQFYNMRFKDNYVAEKDLIEFSTASCHLRQNIAAISEKHLKLPRVQFFQEKNPGWQKGDELTCIAEMTLLMPLTYTLKKIWKGLTK